MMRRAFIRRSALVACAMSIALTLSACENFDPTSLADFIPDSKKKLPGERKAVFPEGVPGVPQGVPPDLVKGAQPQPDVAITDQPLAEPEPVAEEKPKPRPQSKPRPKKVAAPQPASAAPQQAPSAAAQNAPWPDAAPAQAAPPAAQSAPWPAPAQPQQSAPSTAQWPEPRPAGTFTR